MTFEEFLEKCREKDGWHIRNFLNMEVIRNFEEECPLRAVFEGDAVFTRGGCEGAAVRRARAAGLDAYAIMQAADGYTKNEYRRALLSLVKVDREDDDQRRIWINRDIAERRGEPS